MELSIDGGIADLRIGGPIDMDWATGLVAHARTLHGTPGLRVVRLSAEGRFFSPGGDLTWMNAQPDRQQAISDLAGAFHEGIIGLTTLDAPVVAKIHGPAAGGGMSFALCADIAIAGESAWFTMAYTAAGLTPGRRRLLAAAAHRRPAPGDRADPDQPAGERRRSGGPRHRHADCSRRRARRRRGGGRGALRQGRNPRLRRLQAAAAGQRRRLVRRAARRRGRLDRSPRSVPHGHRGNRAFLEKRPPVF